MYDYPDTPFKTKRSEIDTLFKTKNPENYILSGRTSPLSLYKGVPSPPRTSLDFTPLHSTPLHSTPAGWLGKRSC